MVRLRRSGSESLSGWNNLGPTKRSWHPMRTRPTVGYCVGTRRSIPTVTVRVSCFSIFFPAFSFFAAGLPCFDFAATLGSMDSKTRVRPGGHPVPWVPARMFVSLPREWSQRLLLFHFFALRQLLALCHVRSPLSPKSAFRPAPYNEFSSSRNHPSDRGHQHFRCRAKQIFDRCRQSARLAEIQAQLRVS